MEVLRWRLASTAPSPAEVQEEHDQFVNHVRVGLEIEAGGEPNDSGDDCSRDPSDCVCQNCNHCEHVGCNPRVGCWFCRNECEEWDNDDDTCPHRDCDHEGCSHRPEDRNWCPFHHHDICRVCEDAEPDFCGGCDPSEQCQDCDDRSRGCNRDNLADEVSRFFHCSDTGSISLRGKFLKAYNDGSVTTELVTQPLKLADIAAVHQEAVQGLDEDFGLIVSPDENCGGHQTVSMGANFGNLTSRCVVQLVRYYLPALLWIGCIKGTTGRRGGHWRQLPVAGWSKNLGYDGTGSDGTNSEDDTSYGPPSPFNSKYSAVHIKKEHAVEARPYLIEFRYPDGIKYSNIHHLTAILNCALVLRAISLSGRGVPEMAQPRFNLVRDEVYTFYDTGKFAHEAYVRALVSEMKADFAQEFVELGYNLDVITERIDDLLVYPRWMDDEHGDIEAIPQGLEAVAQDIREVIECAV